MTPTKATPTISCHANGMLPLRYAVATLISTAPISGPQSVPRPPSATQMISSVPNAKPVSSGATTPLKAP